MNDGKLLIDLQWMLFCLSIMFNYTFGCDVARLCIICLSWNKIAKIVQKSQNSVLPDRTAAQALASRPVSYSVATLSNQALAKQEASGKSWLLTVLDTELPILIQFKFKPNTLSWNGVSWTMVHSRSRVKLWVWKIYESADSVLWNHLKILPKELKL